MDDTLRTFVAETKARLKSLHDVRKSFAEVTEAVAADVEAIRNREAKGQSSIPEVTFSAVADGKVSTADHEMIKKAGAVIVRGVFPRQQAESWNAELGDYVAENDYFAKAKEKAGIDKYFSDLDAGTPQIFGLYWSRPQVMARQAEAMAVTKRFLNRLWSVGGPMGDEFDPDNDYAYADRTRRRQPGDTTLGLSPHMDSGSYERWLDPAYQRIYGPIFEGHWQDYDPWKATFRTQTREYASPAVCSMFRTFQGWTALTPQGPQDGTLRLVPSAQVIAYILLRALQDDVAADDLCGAVPGRALSVSPEWHQPLLDGLVSIPQVEPGDTVWWHTDVVHAVGDEHHGKDYASVIYIGATPKCEKNEAYARKQAQSFLRGASAPDFAPEDYEVDFKGRATADDLTELGKEQMALS
ncbi:MAG: YbiU family protein [Pseudomonadota bacterium]